jgi:formylglycine-generating enzyme required for sulfatase activity
MMWMRQMRTMIFTVFVVAGLMGATNALATEPVSPKTEITPPTLTVLTSPSPTLSNPRTVARAATLTRKGHSPASALPLPAALLGQDGAPMMLVPAGEFTMGSEQGDDDEQPVCI